MTNQPKAIFTANHAEAVEVALANLTAEEKDSLLRLYAAQESIKKESEINKNYADVRSYNASRFAMQLEDRLRKKIWTSNKVTAVLGGETVAASQQIEAPVVEIESGSESLPELKAAKSGSKKAKA
jgi:hypothetical protein